MTIESLARRRVLVTGEVWNRSFELGVIPEVMKQSMIDDVVLPPRRQQDDRMHELEPLRGVGLVVLVGTNFCSQRSIKTRRAGE